MNMKSTIVVFLVFLAFLSLGILGESAEKPLGSPENQCQSIHVKTQALNCSWMNCESYTVKIYGGNKTFFVGSYNRSQEFVRLLDIQALYKVHDLWYKCGCNDSGGNSTAVQGSIKIKDLPLTIVKPHEKVVFHQDTGYSMNISFLADGILAAQKYIVTATLREEYTAETSADQKNCVVRGSHAYCENLFRDSSSIVIGANVSFQVLSYNHLGKCASRIKLHKVTFYDCYGDPRTPNITQIGTKSAVLKFSRFHKSVMEDPPYELRRCDDSSCQQHILHLNEAHYEHTYEDLQPLTKYHVSVRINSAIYGIFNWTRPVWFTTKSLVPTSGPRTVTCKSQRVGERRSFLVQWEPPRHASNVAIDRYCLKLSYAQSKKEEHTYPAPKNPPYEYSFLAKSSAVSVGVLPCSNSGCGQESIREYTNCIYAEQISSDPQKSSGNVLHVVIGTGVVLIVLSIFCAILFIYVRHRKETSGHESRITDDPIYPRGSYERVQHTLQNEYHDPTKVEVRDTSVIGDRSSSLSDSPQTSVESI